MMEIWNPWEIWKLGIRIGALQEPGSQSAAEVNLKIIQVIPWKADGEDKNILHFLFFLLEESEF